MRTLLFLFDLITSLPKKRRLYVINTHNFKLP